MAGLRHHQKIRTACQKAWVFYVLCTDYVEAAENIYATLRGNDSLKRDSPSVATVV